MQQEDRFSEDVIKIFHNAKGSLRHKIVEWTNDYEAFHDCEQDKNYWKTAYPPTPFDHAAGEYEPLPQKETSSLSAPEGSQHTLELETQSSGEFHPRERTKKTNSLPTHKTDRKFP